MEIVRIKDPDRTKYVRAEAIVGFYFDGKRTIIATSGGVHYAYDNDITQELAKVLTNGVGIKTIVVDKQE